MFGIFESLQTPHFYDPPTQKKKQSQETSPTSAMGVKYAHAKVDLTVYLCVLSLILAQELSEPST